MAPERLTRRQFVRDAAVGAAALAVSVSVPHVVKVGNAEQADTGRILNYNPDMEYRRCGKTGWMVSAVCLGGHWKRVNLMVPGVFQGDSWLSANVNDPGFQKNRYDVVTRCIERGINYIDACTGAEIQAYSKALEGRRDKMYLGWSWYEREARSPSQCNGDALMKVFEDSLQGLQAGVRRPVPHRLRRRRPPRQGRQVGLPAHRSRVGGHRRRACGGPRSRARPGPPASRRTTCRG